MKKIFYNAHLTDSKIDADGAVLVKDNLIYAVVLGSFSDADDARSLISLFGNTEDCANISSEKCNGCKTPCALEFVNCRGKTLMPSFIDMHVHFRYPGQTEKEDLQSGLNAAVSGGFGTVVLMPNTKPVVSSSELAHSIERDAAKFDMAQVIQVVSLTKDFDGITTSHLDDLDGISVLSEDGHDVQNSLVMYDAMSKASVKGALVSCHSEDESFNAQAKHLRKQSLDLYAQYDTTHDEATLIQAQSYMSQANELLAMAEDFATERNIHIAQEANCKIHIAHVSTKNSIEAVRRAKLSGQTQVTCEVTPHHFGLSCDNEENLRLIVNPPIRSEADRKALLQAFRDGTVDVISTDHAPHTLADKLAGAPGFPGLETSFAVANTFLVKQDVISLQRLSALMSANPARILGLAENSCKLNGAPRGNIAAGYLANLVLVDPNEEWTVDSTKFKTKGKVCPFENMELTGKVLATWFCGHKVF